MAAQRGKLSAVLLILQAIFVAIFAIFAEYDQTADVVKFYKNVTKDGDIVNFSNTSHGGKTGVMETYPLFQDTHVMIFLGIGFLLTYLKRYGFTGVGLNLLVGAFVVQWATIIHGLLDLPHSEDGKFHLNVGSLLSGDFTAATSLISFCTVLGKTSPLQIIVMSLLETPLFIVNERLGLQIFKAVDIGESIFIHVFAAYFGMAVARVLHTEDIEKSNKEATVYHSDLFSMIGTLFLWMYWPSFNGAAAAGDFRHRAFINTYFSLAACTVMTCVTSAIVDKRGKMTMAHVQNATLAGGVVMGATADLMVHPWGAVLLGSLAGCICTLGYKYITPFLTSKLKIHDTCGVNNLHGLPGILGAVAGAVVAALATEQTYGKTGLYLAYPARAPEADGGMGRSAVVQGAYQIAALAVTIAVSIVGGLITGFILRLPYLDSPKGDGLFDDGDFWEIPNDGFPDVRLINEAEHKGDTKM